MPTAMFMKVNFMMTSVKVLAFTSGKPVKSLWVKAWVMCLRVLALWSSEMEQNTLVILKTENWMVKVKKPIQMELKRSGFLRKENIWGKYHITISQSELQAA